MLKRVKRLPSKVTVTPGARTFTTRVTLTKLVSRMVWLPALSHAW